MLLKKSEYAALCGVDPSFITREIQRRHVWPDRDGRIDPESNFNMGFTLSHISTVWGDFMSYGKVPKRWELYEVITDQGRVRVGLLAPFDYKRGYLWMPAVKRFELSDEWTAKDRETGKVFELTSRTGAEM